MKEEKVTANAQFLSLHIFSQLAVAIVISYVTAKVIERLVRQNCVLGRTVVRAVYFQVRLFKRVRELHFLDFKLSPCFDCSFFSFG